MGACCCFPKTPLHLACFCVVSVFSVPLSHLLCCCEPAHHLDFFFFHHRFIFIPLSQPETLDDSWPLNDNRWRCMVLWEEWLWLALSHSRRLSFSHRLSIVFRPHL
ncbi:hypothetical protein BJY04DRAFT_180457 [Aspergillus karnatakaensis]|uniref:uncharacterized protein n=1 Tax=Aspergillus karnatakaensis TaxID=1810916 RepID=UPI003CCCD365